MVARAALGLALALSLGGLVLGAEAAEAEVRRDGQGYTLEVVAPPACPTGGTTTATVTVRPRGGWKLNTEYPVKLELAPGPGVRVAKTVLRKDDVRRFVESGIDVDVPITADKAGRSEVAATLKFATCDDAVCAVHKETFTITATAR